jgi:protein O-mannosyl-transferase
LDLLPQTSKLGRIANLERKALIHLTRRKGTVLSGLLLAVLTLSLYSSVSDHPFINFDDQNYVVKNAHIRAGLTLHTFTWALTATYEENWHPLTWISHALDYQLYGLDPAGHHLTNLFFHVLNVVILFLLLLRATGAMGCSLLVAALFALHPVNVESVAWVAERKNVLSTLFFLLALGAYGWYAGKPNLKRYLVLAALFVLGLASKPMVITLPFVLLLLDFWPLERVRGWGRPSPPGSGEPKKRKPRSQDLASARAFSVTQALFSRLVLEKIPLLVLCAGSAVATIVAHSAPGTRSVERFPLAMRLGNALYSYGMYLRKAFWPTRLALYYPFPRNTLTAWQMGLTALFVLGVSVLVWKQRSAHRYLATGWLWYLGTLLPVIGIIQVGDLAMADRYAYIPLIGVFVMVVWGAADWAGGRKINSELRTAAAFTVLVALSFLGWRQIGYWQSDYDLWSHAVAVTTTNPVAENNFGDALMTLGRDEEALPVLREAVRLTPGDPTRHANLGSDLFLCGRPQDAAVEYQKAIQLASEIPGRFSAGVQARSYESLATIYDELGDYSKVRESYRQALNIVPEQGPDMVQRISQYAASVPSGPNYLQLGMLLQEAGKLPEARAAYDQALALNPALDAAIKSLDARETNGK